MKIPRAKKFPSSLFFLLAAAAVLLLYTAAGSTGCHHPDEHYQLIEFAGYYNGTHASADMPWEYQYRLRPSLQPVIAALVFRTTHLAGISNPYTVLVILKILTALMFLAAAALYLSAAAAATASRIRAEWLGVLLLFTWFVPYINVRFSSETWSGIFLLAAMGVHHWLPSAAEKKKRMLFFAAGVLFGLSFQMKYQSAFIIAAYYLWTFIFAKQSRKHLVAAAAGFLLITATGILSDRMFYGGWTLPSWNYLRMVVTLTGPDFGQSEWYLYFSDVFYKAIPPLGVLLMAAVLLFFLRYPGSIYTWMCLPYLAVLLILPHKEMRFLFPLLNLIPFMAVMAFSTGHKKINGSTAKNRVAGILAGLFILTNLVPAVIAARLPADAASAAGKYIYPLAGRGKTVLLHTIFSNPYDPFQAVPLKTFVHPRLKTIWVEHLQQAEDTAITGTALYLLTVRGDTLQPPPEKWTLLFDPLAQARHIPYYTRWFNNEDNFRVFGYKPAP